MIIQYLLFPIPMALAWVMLTAETSPAGFLIGYVLSMALSVMLTRERRLILYPDRLPDQVITLVIYLVILARDILSSGIDVTLRVIGLRPIRAGIKAVPTRCNYDSQMVNEIVAGVSAHSITITPGEMVVDFDGSETMYVHCLDIDHATDKKLHDDQSRRLEMLRRILGI